MTTNEQLKQVESILSEVRAQGPVDADDSTLGQLTAVAMKRIASLDIALGDEQLLVKISEVFERGGGHKEEASVSVLLTMARGV